MQKKVIWSAQALSEALNLTVNPALMGQVVQFNSNDVEKGDIFIALQGNRDGHNYAKEAVARGAALVITSRRLLEIKEECQLVVEDTLAALKKMADYKRQKSRAKLIGITGSVGKTTTKEALKVMLSGFGNTFASRANFNNHLGVPINLASMPDDVDYAILEMGMNRVGEIRSLTEMVRPDIALITWISEAHLEFFNSVMEIADAKCEIFEGLSKEGKSIISIDNKYYGRMMFNLERLGIKAKNIYTFGKSAASHSQLASYQKIGDKVRLSYKVFAHVHELELPFIPEHFARNFAACLMIASVVGLDTHKAAQSLSKIELIDGRGKIIKVTREGKYYQLICDYYNANPASLKASLEYFTQVNHPKKVAIIGDMPELGEASWQLHLELIPYILASGASKIFLVGEEVKCMYAGLMNNIIAKCFDDADALIANIDNLIEGEELVLIKGGRRLKLEKIIQCFQET